MAKFRRQKLFSSTININKDNFFHEENWICSIENISLIKRYFRKPLEKKIKKIYRYRIKFQKFLRSEYGAMENNLSYDLESANENFENEIEYSSPSIICFLEVWNENHGWIQCINIPVEINPNYITVCSEINEMYRSFLTGGSLDNDLMFDYIAPTPETQAPLLPPSDNSQVPNTKKEEIKNIDDDEWI